MDMDRGTLGPVIRFQTRFDTWLVVILILAILVSCVAPALLALAHRSGAAYPFYVSLPIWLIAIAATLPQYYEIRAEGLFLRQGWRKNLIRFEDLTEIQPMSDSRSAGVFSTERILIVTRENRRFLIAVREQECFLDELSRRCPQMVRLEFGLAMPFSAPTIN